MGLIPKGDSPEKCEALILQWCQENRETVRSWYSRAKRHQTPGDLENIVTAFVGKYGSERTAIFLSDPARFWQYKGAVWIMGQKQYDAKPAAQSQQRKTGINYGSTAEAMNEKQIF